MGRTGIITICITALLFAAMLTVSVLDARKGNKVTTTVVTDTLVVHDTVRIIEPKEVQRTVIKTVYVPATDTLTLHDTLYVRLTREAVRYADSTYTAFVSGIQPRLDSIYVYPETRYINTMVETVRSERKKHWGVGVTAGYGISTQGFVPYIGIGISYNIITF